MGGYWYTAWAVDSGGLYGPATSVAVDVPLNPDQAGTLEVSNLLATPTVTVTTQPPNMTLAGTAALAAGTLTVTLDVTNDAPRVLSNVKARMDAVGQGTVDTAVDGTTGTYQDQPVVWYGPEVIDVAATKTRTITITGVDGTVDPLTIDLSMLTHHTLVAPGGWNEGFTLLDSSGAIEGVNNGTFGAVVLSTPTKYQGGGSDSQYHVGAFSVDGTTLYAGQHNMPRIAVIDMTTSPPTQTAGADLSAGMTDIGHISHVTISPDQAFLYAVVTTGDHQTNSGTQSANGAGVAETVDLVKIDITTMMEVGRANLATSADESRGRNVSLTADGATAVVGVGMTGVGAGVGLEQVFVVDTTTMMPTAVDVSAVGQRLHGVAVDAAGTTAHASFKEGDGTLASIDLATNMVTSLTPTTTFTDPQYGNLTWTAAGLLVPRGDDLLLYDPTTMTWTQTAVGASGALAFSGDGSLMYRWDIVTDDVTVHDAATFMAIDADGFAGNGDNVLEHDDIQFGDHVMLLSPF